MQIDSPVGILVIGESDGAITGLTFGETKQRCGGSSLLRNAARQLGEYFEGCRREFELPLSPRGTEFQKKVWAALLRIPYGETASYGEIAAAVGNAKAARAVGLANNRNPIAVIIPCHRVIGSDGSLVGYGGGLETKRFLLKLESVKTGRPEKDRC